MSHPVTQIIIDLDGVLADFVLPTLRLFTDDPQSICNAWPPGEYRMHEILGIKKHKFWAAIDKAGFNHWFNLPPYPWHKELFDACAATAPTIIASMPSFKPASVTGKVRWIQKHFGGNFRDYAIGAHKHFLAKPGAVLIDDSDDVCNQFDEAGGMSIVFPQPWNSNHALAADPMAHVMEELQMLHPAEAAAV